MAARGAASGSVWRVGSKVNEKNDTCKKSQEFHITQMGNALVFRFPVIRATPDRARGPTRTFPPLKRWAFVSHPGHRSNNSASDIAKGHCIGAVNSICAVAA